MCESEKILITPKSKLAKFISKESTGKNPQNVGEVHFSIFQIFTDEISNIWTFYKQACHPKACEDAICWRDYKKNHSYPLFLTF